MFQSSQQLIGVLEEKMEVDMERWPNNYRLSDDHAELFRLFQPGVPLYDQKVMTLAEAYSSLEDSTHISMNTLDAAFTLMQEMVGFGI